MFRRLGISSFLFLLLAAACGGLLLLRSHNSDVHQLQRALVAQQQRNEQLKQFVQRLTAERRVAEILVKDRSESAGIVRTTLLFVEYARDGVTPLPAKEFTIEGAVAHIDAMVIKFDGKFVEENDPLRGHSIALFTRLYGENQSPADAFPIDSPGEIPDVYRGDGKVSRFEQGLWENFWKLADDPQYRGAMGVRVAQGEGVWRGFEPGWLYTLTLESNGGLNIAAERPKAIYQELLKSRAAIPAH